MSSEYTLNLSAEQRYTVAHLLFRKWIYTEMICSHPCRANFYRLTNTAAQHAQHKVNQRRLAYKWALIGLDIELPDLDLDRLENKIICYIKKNEIVKAGTPGARKRVSYGSAEKYRKELIAAFVEEHKP